LEAIQKIKPAAVYVRVHAIQNWFQTGRFVESLLAQTLIIHIVRTAKIPFIESVASPALIATSVVISVIGITLPFTWIGATLGFVPLPPLYWPAVIAINRLLCPADAVDEELVRAAMGDVTGGSCNDFPPRAPLSSKKHRMQEVRPCLTRPTRICRARSPAIRIALAAVKRAM
jgi:hypothetical protein